MGAQNTTTLQCCFIRRTSGVARGRGRPRSSPSSRSPVKFDVRITGFSRGRSAGPSRRTTPPAVAGREALRRRRRSPARRRARVRPASHRSVTCPSRGTPRTHSFAKRIPSITDRAPSLLHDRPAGATRASPTSSTARKLADDEQPLRARTASRVTAADLRPGPRPASTRAGSNVSRNFSGHIDRHLPSSRLLAQPFARSAASAAARPRPPARSRTSGVIVPLRHQRLQPRRRCAAGSGPSGRAPPAGRLLPARCLSHRAATCASSRLELRRRT
jgi:hypothetical protein